MAALSTIGLLADGGDPADVSVPGPQPAAGDGRRLLGQREGSGPSFRTGIASERSAYRRLWRRAGMPGRPPAVDFEQDVVLWFAEGHGSSCPTVRLEDVVVDAEVVYPLLVDPEANMACTADLTGAWQFLVALDRARLPAAPFVVQLGPKEATSSVRRDRTMVEVDLRPPGTRAGPGEIHADRSAREPQAARSGDAIGP